MLPVRGAAIRLPEMLVELLKLETLLSPTFSVEAKGACPLARLTLFNVSDEASFSVCIME